MLEYLSFKISDILRPVEMANKDVRFTTSFSHFDLINSPISFF